MQQDYAWHDIRSPQDWLSAVEDADRRGEFLLAHDAARHGLRNHPGDIALQYHAVRALARSGATNQAIALYEACNLGGQSEEDIAALGARLTKDRALATDGSMRRQRFAEAADSYEAIYRRTGGTYPGINAATLHVLSGNGDHGRAIAEKVRQDCHPDAGGSSDYYAHATQAEAALLLGDLDAAATALRQASDVGAQDIAAIATTRRQLALICQAEDIDVALLDAIALPSVIHYTGHMIAAPGAEGRFPAELEDQVTAEVRAWMDGRIIGSAYGSLACGADIIVAEAALERGIELNAVLPFAEQEFIATSVSRGGPGWEDRFHTCLRRATSVTWATEDSYLDDDTLFRYAGEIAMGLALLRADWVGAPACQLAIWDGGKAAGLAGTGLDVETWRKQGLPSEIIAVGEGKPKGGGAAQAADPGPELVRQVRAILFGDFEGFSELNDREVRLFHDQVLGALGRALEGYESQVRYRNTWGDSVLVVFDHVEAAARCALDMQAAVDAIDLESLGLPETLGLRLAGHIGPVFAGEDPVRKEPAYYGSHMTRAARMEPVTPRGQVYVSGPFAAGLALSRAPGLSCEYVGHLPTAKEFGEMRMHVLVAHDG